MLEVAVEIRGMMKKGLFTDGPSSLSAYASDKTVKAAFNEDGVKKICWS